MNILKKHIDRLRTGRDLETAEAETFLDALITEADENLLADIFRSWDGKGIKAGEIFELARLMRERCTSVGTVHTTFVDVVGTGGGRNKTFNISTAAAFVVAGAGIAVAKHGNKAATSNSGSADVLSALGVEPAVDSQTAERCLNEIGICFMFAPNFHRLSPTLAKVRRGLGFPTIFNCVGPLCNPANAPHQLIGVWNKDLVFKMASALSQLGTKKSWIVHGVDGTDEISLGGVTRVAEIEDGRVRDFEISPEDFGLAVETTGGVKATSPLESAAVIREVLGGGRRDTFAERLVLVNAAAAIYIADGASNLRDAYDAASDSIMSGRAKEKLNSLADRTKR